jgi:hypothetical protein
MIYSVEYYFNKVEIYAQILSKGLNKQALMKLVKFF